MKLIAEASKFGSLCDVEFFTALQLALHRFFRDGLCALRLAKFPYELFCGSALLLRGKLASRTACGCQYRALKNRQSEGLTWRVVYAVCASSSSLESRISSAEHEMTSLSWRAIASFVAVSARASSAACAMTSWSWRSIDCFAAVSARCDSLSFLLSSIIMEFCSSVDL